MADRIRWGILGTGRMASDFAIGLTRVDDAELVAVGSRSSKSACLFAEKFGVSNAHPSYERLANDASVDVVYIATPHTLHYENALMCMKSGKAVLCEKPFTINAREAETLIRYARDHNVFLMEAMWTRFIPAVIKLRELLRKML